MSAIVLSRRLIVTQTCNGSCEMNDKIFFLNSCGTSTKITDHKRLTIPINGYIIQDLNMILKPKLLIFDILQAHASFHQCSGGCLLTRCLIHLEVERRFNATKLTVGIP